MILGSEIKPGFYVMLTGDSVVEGKVFYVKDKEGSDYETGRTTGTAEFSTVASGSSTSFKNIDRIEPDKGQVAWYSWYVRDGAEYQMKLKAGTIRFGPQQEPNVGFIDNEKSGPTDPNEKYSFWLFNDWFPSVQANNKTPYTMTPKVYFEGFKFDVQEIKDSGEVERIKASGRYSILVLGGVSKT